MNIVFGVIGALLLIGLIFIFNRFVSYRNNVKDAWSNIDVFLKKRYELVPTLVSTVKGYAKHEHQSFLDVAEARSTAMALPTNQPLMRAGAESELSGLVKSVIILQEDYPDLKANNSFIDLQKQLAELEEDLEKSRRYYNATVRENNTFGERFPGNLFRRLFRYQHYDYFSIKVEQRKVKEVDF